jgi:hypothetical protein
VASEKDKSVVGRQTKLPFSRAFQISMKSLRIRFWRSMITAGGIFLGIAFLATVLTQSLMQWPLPEKIDAGMVKIDGQVNGPGEYPVWKPIPVQAGLDAGIPREVIDRVNKGSHSETFSLTAVVQGMVRARTAEKKLARLHREEKAMRRLYKPFWTYVRVLERIPARKVKSYAAMLNESADAGDLDNGFRDIDAKAKDAKLSLAEFALKQIPEWIKADYKPAQRITNEELVSAGLSKSDAAALNRRGKETKLAVAILLSQRDWKQSLFGGVAGDDRDISLKDALSHGVPATVAKRLAGQGAAFKASALRDAIASQPDQIKTWESRLKRNAIYNSVDQAAVDKLDVQYAITLNEALAIAKGFLVTSTSKKNRAIAADKSNIMITNIDGRRISANLAVADAKAGEVRIKAGDNVMVPDSNSKYRMYWLVVMSLLVCAVGITNSMLMSVTERFKEIGTMKCLGAMDKFVVELFMLEAGMMGVVASVLGFVVGFLAIVLVAGFSRGWDIVGNIQFIDVLGKFGISIGAGMVLTTVATIAPAIRAANMPPAMALRSEI